MATMVKEKRREKKKTKEKPRVKADSADDICITPSETITEEVSTSGSISIKKVISEVSLDNVLIPCDNKHLVTPSISTDKNTTSANILITESQEFPEGTTDPGRSSNCSEENEANRTPQNLELNCAAYESNTKDISFETTTEQTVSGTSIEKATDSYEYLSTRLQRMTIPNLTEHISEARELELSKVDAYLRPSSTTVTGPEHTNEEVVNLIPSAPIFEDEIQPQVTYQEEVVVQVKKKLQCMPLEEAVNMFGGAEMIAVKVMSEREEAIVEAGPVSGPEHPLVDLLSTFRSSLRALENERSRLASGFADEEKSRISLWKIEKRNINLKKQCKCGSNVELKAVYEHAELLREKLPVARLRLESLIRDVQDSYCHHQHAALLAHCQIEELIAETVKCNKGAVREALSLVLQALRMSDGAALLAAALRRWAAALVAALVDERDVSQLLFVVHHLFRQSRSVRWAARVLRPRVTDAASAARTLAVLDTLLASPRLDSALECTEDDAEEEWEEVSVRGVGGAVSEGALREIDLLALMRAFPLADLVARLLMFTHSDIRDARAYEWGDAAGGRGVLRASGGVRALLATCRRAAAAHAHYARLRAQLRALAAAALQGLACFYQSPRAPYHKDLEEKIQAELEACFTAGLEFFGTQDLHKLPTTLLSESAAQDYCLTLIVGLHDKSPKLVESLSIETPALSCDTRVRLVTHAAALRTFQHELAGTVLDFLIQTGAKVKSTSCKGGCVGAARECVSILLDAHPYLRTAALHIVANLAQVETLDESVVDVVHVHRWRPDSGEAQAVLDDWSRRCPLLLHRLLLLLDYTPFTGISLPVQLLISGWLCEWSRSRAASAELCWRVLLRTRTHRVCWRAPLAAPAPAAEPSDAISTAHALLATSWGHSIPLICSSGVTALCSLTSRPREAMHCLAPIMLVMAHSPESVSLTPKFTELFTALLSCGPTLVQRAFGRGGVSGADLLLKLLLTQIEGETYEVVSRSRVLSAWLHALSRITLPAAAAILDAAALAARDWPTLDAHATILLEEENAKEYVTNAVRNASIAPLLCECLLRAYHTHRELNTGMFGALANVLWEQRINAQKIHVDNALQKIKSSVCSEELVIYRSACAALAAPLHHPSHLTLWRLFFHLYLQRPPNNMRDTALPVGPLYFSGLIKTRTLTQIKKRLQETATYHHTEAETYKKDSSRSSQTPSNRVVKSESITIEKGILPALSIKDLTGESCDSSDSDSDSVSESEGDSKFEAREVDVSEVEKKNAFNMACYHTAAERMVREFCSWLEDGDQVRASPHHADIARFIPEQALEAAWKHALSLARPPPEDSEPFPHPASDPPPPPESRTAPLDVAVDCIMKINVRARTSPRRKIISPLEDIDATTSNRLFDAIDKHLRDIDTVAKDWNTEVSRISTIDNKLWDLVAALRVPRPLPPVTKQCPNTKAPKKCKPVIFYINEREWCISTGAEQAIKENRSSSRAALRRLCRPRPHFARTVAALHYLARSVRDASCAADAAERAWRAAAAHAHCGAAARALEALVLLLAERWIHHDAIKVNQLLSRWCSKSDNSLQETLCGSLLSPRRMEMDKWPMVYNTLLKSKLPSHTIFSYLSKFEMGPWSRAANPAARRELLNSIISAQSQHGATPAPQHSVLLELLGVHTTAATTGEELCGVVMQCAVLAADGKLPPRQWAHVASAAVAGGGHVPFDQLGHLLRDLGALWWQTRSLYNGATTLVPHATYVAELQSTLLRCFVAAAVTLSYQPERVGRCAWSALLESWGAWVSPHPSAAPLLPSLAAERDGQYSRMLRCFLAALTAVMADCPGTEIPLLQLTFEWCVATRGAVASTTRQESRVQASELLATLAALPWTDHQWFYGASLQIATQICASNDRELMSWSCDRWRATDADTLLRDVTHDALAPRLAALLYLFTGSPLRHKQHILDEASRLPWWQLPEVMLGEALDRFFAVHHNAALAYHDLPEFQVLLFASELRVNVSVARPVAAGRGSRDKRERALSQWTHAAAAPALHAHVAPQALCILDTLTQLVPHLDSAGGELEELLGRATVIMCMEPAAAEALPVWQKWVSSGSAHLASACVSAACAITALPYCAALADAAVRAHMRTSECGWSEVARRWSAESPWRDAAPFAARARLHAAYACARAFDDQKNAGTTLQALQTADINFVEDEAIVAVWICYACRVALSCATSATSATSSASEREECGQTARALIGAWAQPPRRSILRVVTLQTDTNRTTALQRLLCRYAECVLTPSAEAVQSYETACTAAPGSNNDVLTWGRSATLNRLPKLAIRLYPKFERYFHCELAVSGAK